MNIFSAEVCGACHPDVTGDGVGKLRRTRPLTNDFSRGNGRAFSILLFLSQRG